MAETIGLGASIVTLTAQLATISFKYTNGVKRARNEIQNLVYEIKTLSIVFTNLEVCVRDDTRLTQLKELQDPLQKCTLQIENFLKRLKPKGWLAKIKVTLLAWPFDKNETSDFILRMERYKALFLPMLDTIEM